jgi:hypothetical protein
VFAFSPKSGGYGFEVQIPWNTLGIIPSDNLKIGLDVAIDDNDNGVTRTNQQMWSGTATNWQNTSAWGTANLSSSLITSVEEVESASNISVYPNPTNGKIFINASTENVSWEIYNSDGMMLQKGTSKEIQTIGTDAGTYILKINNVFYKVIKY